MIKEKLEFLEQERIKRRRELDFHEKIEMNKLTESQIVSNIKQDKEKLIKNLIILLRKIEQIKLMISELKREINIEVNLSKDFLDKNELDSIPNINIRVENHEEGTVYYWNIETFHNRFDLTKELFNKYMEEDLDINSLSKEDDPLWDEQDETLMGYAFFKLEPLAYLIAIKNEIKIINPYSGELMGIIEVEIIPHDDKNNEFDEVPENPSDLVGQNLLYKIRIIKIKKLNINFCKNLRIEYQSFYDKSINYTKIYNQNEKRKIEFDIGEEYEHKIEYLTMEDIDFLQKENIKFKIFASEEVDKKERIKIPEKKKNQNIVQNNNQNNSENNGKINIINNYMEDEQDEPIELIKREEEKKEVNNYIDDKNKIKIDKIKDISKNKDCIIF